MRMSPTSTFAAGAVFALVIGGGTAVAATGYKMIVGQSNYASTTTTLSNSGGTALSLKSKTGTAPLAVSNSTRVYRLNADTVDGVDSSDLARTSGRSGSLDVSGVRFDSDEDGTDDSVVAQASCPSGSQMTGGGGTDLTSSGYLFSSAPDQDGGETWTVVVGFPDDDGDPQTPVAVPEGAEDDVVASVVCYNPTGAVPGSYRHGAAHRVRKPTVAPTISPALRAKAAHLAH